MAKKYEIPIWEKFNLTIEEAAAYFHIGEARLREMIFENANARYILRNGNRILIKRKAFEEYLSLADVV